MPDVTMPFKCTHWYQHRKGGHKKIITNRQGFLSIISPRKSHPAPHSTIHRPSELGSIICMRLILDPLPSPPPQGFLYHFHVCWFYNKVRIKTLQGNYQSPRKFLINIMNRFFFLCSHRGQDDVRTQWRIFKTRLIIIANCLQGCFKKRKENLSISRIVDLFKKIGKHTLQLCRARNCTTHFYINTLIQY